MARYFCDRILPSFTSEPGLRQPSNDEIVEANPVLLVGRPIVTLNADLVVGGCGQLTSLGCLECALALSGGATIRAWRSKVDECPSIAKISFDRGHQVRSSLENSHDSVKLGFECVLC